MLLAIDVGNTQTVFGVYEAGKLRDHVRLSTERNRTHDEYGVLLRELLSERGIALSQITDAVLASVVPPLTPTLERMCETRFSKPALVIGPGVKTGMPVLYESPKDVGADRIADGVAAYERWRTAPGGPFGVILVDFGTATTFNVVSPRGEYMGGAIAPGIVTATEALFSRASKLPRIELTLPPSAIGKSTVTSMQSGILFGYVGLVDGMVERMRGELDFEPKVMATGGLAAVIAGHSKTIETVDEFLTLEGLRLIFERNQRSGR